MGKSKRFGELAKAVSNVISTVFDQDLFERLPIEPQKDIFQQQLREGQHLFAPEQIEVNKDAAWRAGELLLGAFTGQLGDRANELEELSRACQSGQLPADELLIVTLNNSLSELQGYAWKLGLDINLLQLFSMYLARPFLQQAAKLILVDVDLKVWQMGYCPVCGHWPVLGTITGVEVGRKQLWCCWCNTRWHFRRIGCYFCRNQSQDQLGYLAVDTFPAYRIYICDLCKRYLKFIKYAQEESDSRIDYDFEYLSTTELDSFALSEGYLAEPVWLVHCGQPLRAGGSDSVEDAGA